MKKISTFIIIIFLLILSFAIYIFFQDNVKIPNSMVKSAVSSKFPIEKSYPGGKIKLYNPNVTFKNDRLLITTDYFNDALGEEIKGKMTFNTNLRYDFVSSKLYLKDFQLDSVSRNGEEVEMKKHPLIRMALGIAFSKLEKEQLLDVSKIEKFQTIKDIIIENNKIVIKKDKL